MFCFLASPLAVGSTGDGLPVEAGLAWRPSGASEHPKELHVGLDLHGCIEARADDAVISSICRVGTTCISRRTVGTAIIRRSL